MIPEGKYSYDRTLITLETITPQLPSKNEIIIKPERYDLDDKLDELDRKIDDVHDKLEDYIDEVRRDAINSKNKRQDDPIKNSLKGKSA